jgi:hypothetical protein
MAVLMERALVFIAFCEYKALTLVLITDIALLHQKNLIGVKFGRPHTQKIPQQTGVSENWTLVC